MTEPVQAAEVPIIWKSYPSWTHFTWLYFFSALAALRGMLFLRFGVGGEGWLLGALLLLGTAVVARRWAENVLTSTHVVVRNGYTGRELQSLPLADIKEAAIKQGPVAGFFDIGTILLKSGKSDQIVSLKGVKNPDIFLHRVNALMPNGSTMRTVHEGFL